jgi:hypothetical protein
MSDDEGMPRWVKVSAILALLLALLIAVVLLVGGGDHGPGRHFSGHFSSSGGSTPWST